MSTDPRIGFRSHKLVLAFPGLGPFELPPLLQFLSLDTLPPAHVLLRLRTALGHEVHIPMSIRAMSDLSVIAANWVDFLEAHPELRK